MSRPKRLPSFDYLGFYAYALTFCTESRQRHFDEVRTVNVVCAQILRTADESAFAVLAYCFMPDHLHLLVQGLAPDSHLRPFVRLLRQRASVESRTTRLGTLWQEGYFERTLRGLEDVTTAASYIAHNPVRAGLVSSAADWPYSGGTLLDTLNRT